MTEEKYTNILTDKQLELFIKIRSLVDKINEGNSFRKLSWNFIKNKTRQITRV